MTERVEKSKPLTVRQKKRQIDAFAAVVNSVPASMLNLLLSHKWWDVWAHIICIHKCIRCTFVCLLGVGEPWQVLTLMHAYFLNLIKRCLLFVWASLLLLTKTTEWVRSKQFVSSLEWVEQSSPKRHTHRKSILVTVVVWQTDAGGFQPSISIWLALFIAWHFCLHFVCDELNR